MSESPAVKENELQKVERAATGVRVLPAVDVFETRTELVAVLDMPGVSRDGIDVEYEDRTLTIQGRVSESASTDRANLWREYHKGHYFQTFNVRQGIDVGKVAAEYEDGVLTVRLPKRESAVPRKISVDVK